MGLMVSRSETYGSHKSSLAWENVGAVKISIQQSKRQAKAHTRVKADTDAHCWIEP